MTTGEGRSSRTGAAARGRQAPQKRSLPLIPVLLGAGVLVALIVGVFFFTNRATRVPAAEVAPGGPVPTMESRDHVADGTPVQYSTNPPTSGPHWAQAATWGIYNSTPPADERLVHNLEHGGVIISYDPAQVDAQTVEQLKELTRDLRRERTCLILTPRPGIQDGKPIALTAWGALALLDEYDESLIRAFWRDYVARGPEFPQGTCA